MPKYMHHICKNANNATNKCKQKYKSETKISLVYLKSSPGKCTKANKLSFNTEIPAEPEELFRGQGGAAYLDQFLLQK